MGRKWSAIIATLCICVIVLWKILNRNSVAAEAADWVVSVGSLSDDLFRAQSAGLKVLRTSDSIGVKSWDDARYRQVSWNASTDRESAVLVMLVRNEELHAARSAMRQIEDRFNRRFGYPWVFLNDQPFTEDFVQLTSALATGETNYGLIPRHHWSFPKHIDKQKARDAMKAMEGRGVLYGGSESYRHMCRFNSGFFFQHPLLQPYDYYWRVEPYTEYYCDMYEDPFTFMRENQKVYGFVMSLFEFIDTIPTLWETVREFAKLHPEYISEDNAAHFMVDDRSKGLDGDYNLCHFWSNFEIADLRFFRSKAYMDYFTYLDKAGGFFYERWGDAPVHSIAAVFFLPKTAIHFFDSIGYRHSPYIRCTISFATISFLVH